MGRRTPATIVARTVVNGVRSRIARREVERQLAARALPEADTYVVAVHFPDFPVNLYQLRQWYEPLRRLSAELPVVVIARYATTARALLAECPVPVTLARSIGDVETLLAAHPVRAVLYVNQNVRSFSVMRYRDPSHVFISHGESDKDYMASNQLKAYDTALVAGPAAVERLRTRLIGYDVDTRTRQIGRPQVDVVDAAPDLPEDGRTVVLYAPTWEGDRPSMTYGSVASHGEALVTALLADRRHRVVFRPHPRTGSSDPAAAAAVRRISRLLGAANRQDPTARHLVDTETPFGWHLHRCDACVTDISAVAYDWLATAKPLVVTEPADPEAVVDRTGLVGALDLLRADEAATLPARLEALQGGEGRTEHADLVAHYYGDVTPGASMARFLAAVRAVVEEREAVLRTRGDAGP